MGKKTACLVSILASLVVSLSSEIIYLNLNPVKEEIIVEKEVEVLKEVEILKEVEVFSTIYVKSNGEKITFTQDKPYSNSKVYSVTKEERDTLARLLYLEAGAESIECQKMVMSVFFNIYDSYGGKKTINSIVYQKGLFSPANRIPYTIPKQEQYDVVDFIIENGSILPKYVKYFRDNYHHQWEGYEGYCNIDGMYFGYNIKDKKIDFC